MAEGVGHLSGHPPLAGPAPALVVLEHPLRLARIAADQPVKVKQAVEVVGLVLQAPGEETGALDRDRLAFGVEALDPRPAGPAGRKHHAGYRKAALEVVIRV